MLTLQSDSNPYQNVILMYTIYSFNDDKEDEYMFELIYSNKSQVLTFMYESLLLYSSFLWYMKKRKEIYIHSDHIYITQCFFVISDLRVTVHQSEDVQCDGTDCVSGKHFKRQKMDVKKALSSNPQLQV